MSECTYCDRDGLPIKSARTYVNAVDVNTGQIVVMSLADGAKQALLKAAMDADRLRAVKNFKRTKMIVHTQKTCKTNLPGKLRHGVSSLLKQKTLIKRRSKLARGRSAKMDAFINVVNASSTFSFESVASAFKEHSPCKMTVEKWPKL